MQRIAGSIIFVALTVGLFWGSLWAQKIIHPNCFYEPEFNRKFAANLGGTPLRRLFRGADKILGKGSFGSVKEIQWAEGGKTRPMAVKFSVIADVDDEEALNREIEIMYRLRDVPYAATISGCVETMVKLPEYKNKPMRGVYILSESLMQDLDDRDGSDRIVSHFRRKFSNERRIFVILNLAKALQAVHKFGIVHSDLKPANIMTTSAEMLDIKIVDFGLSNFEGGKIIGATQLFAPPEYEAMPRVPLVRSFDVYSFGVTVGAIEGPISNIDRRVSHYWRVVDPKPRQSIIKNLVAQSLYFGYRDKPKLASGDHIIKVIADCMASRAHKRPTMDVVVRRLEAIAEDKRGYMITPLEHKLEYDASGQPGRRQEKEMKFVKGQLVDFDFQDTEGMVIKPEDYKDMPLVPTPNTQFGIQPVENPAAQTVQNDITMAGSHVLENPEKMYKEDDFWASQIAEERQVFGVSYYVVTAAVLGGCALLVYFLLYF